MTVRRSHPRRSPRCLECASSCCRSDSAAALAGLALGPVAASYPGHHNGRIAFGIRGADGANIYSIHPNGTGQKQLTKGTGFHLCPSFSADGRTIAYCSNLSGSWEIWTMRANGTNQRQLTHLGGFATFPDFSPDGKTIAFGGTEGADEHTEIYAVDAKTGGGLHALTSCAAYAGDASTTCRSGRRTGRRSRSCTATNSTPTATPPTNRSG